MPIELTTYEARVIGCLIEKEITTPDQYPLSLLALTSACNQKSNRAPVLKLGEDDVQQTVDGLIKKHLVSEKGGFGSRVPKFQHRFCNSEFGQLQFTDQELAIVCELLLRGSQTPGELRTRAGRLAKFSDVSQVEAALVGLMERDDGPFVAKLSREPNKRDSRFAHLFSGEVQAEVASQSAIADAEPAAQGGDRVDRLEQQIVELRLEVERLKSRLEELVPADEVPQA